MYHWFFICLIGAIAIIPLHFLSVEHLKLQENYGKEKGIKIGEIFGLISGWGFFCFWLGIWISPQPRFTIPLPLNIPFVVPVLNFSIPLLHMIFFTLFLIPGVWLAINGVKETTLKVSETHRTEKIVTTGVYSIMRHPQYLGGLFAHVGISFLFSAWYSLLGTPLMFVLNYLMAKKEEEELLKEFGNEYEVYQRKVPMLMPRGRRKR